MNSVEQTLNRATLQILQPLIRILLKHRISHKVFTEFARRTYVKVARQSFALPERKDSYARVAVVTGLSRKEVVRLSMIPEDELLPPNSQPNRALRVINGWLTDAEFLNKKNKPLTLPLRGESASLQALVKRYSGDISAGAVLDELVRLGVVTVLDNNRVRLAAPAFIPAEDDAEKFEVLGLCVTDLLETIRHNISSEANPPYFQRQIVYHDMPAKVIEEFERISREKSEALLLEMNRWLAAQKKSLKPPQPGELRGRIGLGIYYVQSAMKEVGDES